MGHLNLASTVCRAQSHTYVTGLHCNCSVTVAMEQTIPTLSDV